MRFDYQYRTRTNEHKSGTIAASSRDAAFAALKREGINPSRVELAPGVLNRIQSFGKRGLAILVLGVLCLILAVSFFRTNDSSVRRFDDSTIFQSLPRHQIAALPSDWTTQISLYLQPADCYLAMFAQPGFPDAIGIVASPGLFTADYLEAPVPSALPDEPAWMMELKGILIGMKEEALALVRNGKSPADVLLWLRERQRMEDAYRRQVLEGDGTDAEKRHRLQAMGL